MQFNIIFPKLLKDYPIKITNTAKFEVSHNGAHQD